MQTELIKQVILTEAKKDLFLKQFLAQHSQQMLNGMPENAITTAIRNVIAQLS
ncbi:hypothetical protein [Allocoleopsis franciscana]|uniref:Uncharacterized protein n=1 Tax=Allocoleopsis franciscana PCC 7113 TaxID=1173027 RepID=K9WF08_9CYAN|nr:hypothetical protein [Allocoleopsis franciscana]AFZ18077.1 hypothetical protein Mic7113_2265 [Allocoleopsis franciscana PCC 7113]